MDGYLSKNNRRVSENSSTAHWFTDTRRVRCFHKAVIQRFTWTLKVWEASMKDTTVEWFREELSLLWSCERRFWPRNPPPSMQFYGCLPCSHEPSTWHSWIQSTPLKLVYCVTSSISNPPLGVVSPIKVCYFQINSLSFVSISFLPIRATCTKYT
jgi:hypothetical protein